MTGPLSFSKTGYVARGNIALLRCLTASPAQNKLKFFFFLCILLIGAMPPFNYTGHLHIHTLSELGLRGGVAITIELEPAAINERGKKLPVQFVELNDTSFCNLLNLIWPQPMRLEISWKLNKLTVIEEY